MNKTKLAQIIVDKKKVKFTFDNAIIFDYHLSW